MNILRITARAAIMAMTAVAVFAGCSADDEPAAGKDKSDTSAYEGQPIKFTAATIDTRTTLGDISNNTYPVYWETDEEMVIMSPQCGYKNANTSSYLGQAATYRALTGSTASSDIDIPNGENRETYGLRWSDRSKYNFCAITPASVVNKNSSSAYSLDYTSTPDSSVTITIDDTQTCELSADADGNIEAAPDMSHCVMLGRAENIDRGAKTVQLTFTPLSTLLDLTITNEGTDEKQESISKIGLQLSDVQYYDNMSTYYPFQLSGTYVFGAGNYPTSNSKELTKPGILVAGTDDRSTTAYVTFKNEVTDNNDGNVITTSNGNTSATLLATGKSMHLRIFLLLPTYRRYYSTASSSVAFMPIDKIQLDTSYSGKTNPLTLTITFYDGANEHKTMFFNHCLYPCSVNYVKIGYAHSNSQTG